ncbi:MAG: NYN domain-containing protein [Chloroflexi bacterium]|nr:NYN domain-containing protein [Chloroflexota bacterium]
MNERPRMMIFVDGENLVFRYQAMIQNRALRPSLNTFHKQDEYVWAINLQIPGMYRVIRAYYYTSIVGDDPKIENTINEMKSLSVSSSGPGSINKLYPVVFKKPLKTYKSRRVDIQMTIDILTHIHRDTIDAVYLISGDGDFSPVLNEVISHGKHAYVGALSDGFSTSLQQAADVTVNLDSIFFNLEV